MKRTIRRGVFETNSSSTHSLTICTAEVYDEWCKSETLYMDGDGKLFTYEEVAAEAKKNTFFIQKGLTDQKKIEEFINDWISDEYKTFNYYKDRICSDYETFERKFETPNGDKMVAFGYHGYN